MADTVNIQTVHTGHSTITEHWTNESDGTGESAVIKVNISDRTYPAQGPNTVVATYSVVLRIEYSVWGFNYVTLEWDATTPDEIAVLFGQGVMDWNPEGGLIDPQSTGGTGDIELTTDGGANGSGYDISIWYKPKG